MDAISITHKANKIPHPVSIDFDFIGVLLKMAKPWGKGNPPGLRRNVRLFFLGFESFRFFKRSFSEKSGDCDLFLLGQSSDSLKEFGGYSHIHPFRLLSHIRSLYVQNMYFVPPI